MTAGQVALCGCGHAERMHERDAAATEGRGACMHGACGCSEYRLRPAVAAVPDPAPEPETAAPKATTPQFTCDEHGLTFSSVQGRSAHRRIHHPKPPAAAKQGSASEDRSSAPAQSEEGPANTLTPGTATPEKEDPAVAEGDAPLGTAGLARHSGYLRIELPPAGHVEIRLAGVTTAVLVDVLYVVINLAHRPTERTQP